MKKRTYRAIASVLALLMLLGALPAGALAAEPEEAAVQETENVPVVEPELYDEPEDAADAAADDPADREEAPPVEDEPVPEDAPVPEEEPVPEDVPASENADELAVDTDPQPILYFDMEEIQDGKVTNQADGKAFAIEGSLKALRDDAPNGSMALEFDGDTTYLNVGSDYVVKDAFTAAAWVHVSSATRDHAKLFGAGRTGVAGDPTFSISARRNGWNNICYDFTSDNSGWTDYNVMSFDKWVHLAVTGDAKGITIYLDGERVWAQDWKITPFAVPDLTTPLLVGAGWNSAGDAPFASHMFKGAMDEVRLYDVALTAEQVAELAALDEEEIPDEDDPYLKQDGTPAYGVRDAVVGKLNWLETTQDMPVVVTENKDENTLTMENGAIRRVFSVDKTNFYTKSYENTYIGKELMTGKSRPEVYLGLYDKAYGEVYDGKAINVDPDYYYVGGTGENTFQLAGYQVFDACEKPFDWQPRSKSYSDPAAGDWPPPGKRVEFTFTAPGTFPEAYQGVEIKLIYEMYDNCAAMKKRVEITNTKDNMVMVGRLAPDVLLGNDSMTELMYTETTYTSGWDATTPMDESAQEDKYDALHCLCAAEKSGSPFQRLAGTKHTCYDLGPAYELSGDPSVAPHATFASFDTYELVYSTYWFEHQSLERLGFYRKVFPWITDNPLTMHNTSRLSKDVIDHAAEAGFEMIIQSFGSPDISQEMLSRDPDTIAQYKELVDYAHSKNIEIGTYQAQYQLGKYASDPAYGQNAGAVGGGWKAWCMASAAFDDYWDNFRYFVEQTGMDCVEIDGCFAGDACITGDSHVNADRETNLADPSNTTTGNPSKYAFHHGYHDSKVMQWENAVRMLCKEFRDMDVYIKVPAWYYAAGGNKCGIGYDESHWSQPRQHQLAYGRKLMYNASYIRTMSMSWAHVPFAQYHGGGGNAAFQPFADNLFDYNWVVAQYLGNGVAADFRGPSIYDEASKPVLDHWVNVYQRYRGIINSDFVHIVQADSGRDTQYQRNSGLDTLYHVNANNGGAGGEKGLLWVYNQTDEPRTETITVPMFYTGLTSLDYPAYPVAGSMGKEVDHYYGNFTNYQWLPNDVVDQDFPAASDTSDTADFVRDGVAAKTYTIDSNGNVQLTVTLEPMSFTYFAIYDGGRAPEVEVEIGAVPDLQVDGAPERGSVRLAWSDAVPFTVKENGKPVEHPVQTVTGYRVYRDNQLIGTTLTNRFVDETAAEFGEYRYHVTALVGSTEGAKGDGLAVTVQADTDAPELLGVKAAGETQIVLEFSEPMDRAAAENAANYTLTGGLSVQRAALSGDGQQVTLTVGRMTLLQPYTLVIRNLTDAASAKNPLGEQACQVIYGYLASYPLDGVTTAGLENTVDGSFAEAKGVTFTSGTGKNGCVYFNAKDHDCADLGSGLFNDLTDYTISVFVWPSDAASEDVQAVLSAGQPGADKAFDDLGIYMQGGKVRFRTSGANGTGLEAVLESRDALRANTWNQIVVTRAGDVFTLYLNGTLQASVTKEGFPAYNSQNILYLGAQKNNAGGDRTSFFGGRMDELVLYGSAVTPDWVAEAWSGYQPYTGVDPLVYLDFETIEDGKVTNMADGEQYAIRGTEETVTSHNDTQGLKFDGQTAINLGNAYQLGGEFTATAWVKVGTTSDNRNHKIFGRGWTTVAENEFYVCIRNGGYNISGSNADNGGKMELLDFGTPYFPINEWAHLAVVCDGTTVKVYKNGELHTNVGKAENLNLSGNPKELLVGGGWNSTGTGLQGDHTLKGELDEVRLYDAALSQAEIQELMDAAKADGIPVREVQLDRSSAVLKAGDSLALTATVLPAAATNTNVSWSSSDETVATVAGGTVTGIGAGTATITVTTVDGGKTASCVVTVSDPAKRVTGVTLERHEAVLRPDAETTLTAHVQPSDAANQKVIWTSSDPAVATVDASGKVTAVSQGTTVITVTTEDGGFTATCEVTVQIIDVPVEGVTVDPTEATLKVGETVQLTAAVSPDNADIKVVDWSSSDETVATVKENGLVTAVGAGTAQITAKTVNCGYSAICTITVEAAGSPDSSKPSKPSQSVKPAEPAEAEKPAPSGSVEVKVPAVAADENGEAKASVSTSQISSAVTEAAKNNNAEVVIAPEVTGDASKVSVEVTKASISHIVNETEAALTVRTDIADVKLPASSLEELSRQSGSTVTITAEAVDDAVKVEVRIDNTPVEKLRGGVVAQISAQSTNSGNVLVIVNADGSETIVKKSVVDGSTVVGIVDGSCTVKVVTNNKAFADTNTHWAREAVSFAASRELFQGTSAASFSPNAPMNRAMLATVLYRLEDASASGSHGFTDVPSGTWYTDAVTWASQEGIVTGTGNGFNPDGNVTREQLAAMLYRYARSIGMNTYAGANLNRFTDCGKVSGWAEDALVWAVSNGLITGKSEGTLDPTGSATRAEVATVMQRMVTLMVK